MTTIIAICGEAGVGKDTIAAFLADHTDWNRIVSYTTRPMRPGEVNHREHHFVAPDQLPEPSAWLCHTIYPPESGAHYWTTIEQFQQHPINVYVVDEIGMRQLELHADQFRIIRILVRRDASARLASGIDPDRMARDTHRQTLPDSYYHLIIDNNKSLAALHHTLIGDPTSPKPKRRGLISHLASLF